MKNRNDDPLTECGDDPHWVGVKAAVNRLGCDPAATHEPSGCSQPEEKSQAVLRG